MTYPDFIEFNGITYGLAGSYYRKWNYSGPGPSNLHRAIWEHHNGPIPDGHDIHHRDENGLNNDLSNLQCIEAREHQRQHMLERHAKGEIKPISEEMRAKAAEWHGSEQGIEWHREHGKHTWESKEWHPCVCHNCGNEFRSPFPTRAKFCHPNCNQDAQRRRRGIPRSEHNRKPRNITGKRAANQES